MYTSCIDRVIHEWQSNIGIAFQFRSLCSLVSYLSRQKQGTETARLALTDTRSSLAEVGCTQDQGPSWTSSNRSASGVIIQICVGGILWNYSSDRCIDIGELSKYMWDSKAPRHECGCVCLHSLHFPLLDPCHEATVHPSDSLGFLLISNLDIHPWTTGWPVFILPAVFRYHCPALLTTPVRCHRIM